MAIPFDIKYTLVAFHFGSFFRFTTCVLVLTYVLRSDVKREETGCAGCRACVMRCVIFL